MTQLLTAKDVATRLACCSAHAYRTMLGMPHLRLGRSGRLLRVTEEVFEKWLNDQMDSSSAGTSGISGVGADAIRRVVAIERRRKLPATKPKKRQLTQHTQPRTRPLSKTG